MSRRTSKKQLEANRINAKLGGVKTREGKEIVKYNAEKHGILSQTITGYEQEIYKNIFDELKMHYQPNGIIESLLVEKIATVYIKSFRIAKAENEYMRSILNPSVEKAELYENMLLAEEGYEPKVKVRMVENLQNIYSRYETTTENRLYKAMHELERIQRMRKGEKISAPLAVDVEVNKMGSFGEN